MAFDDCPEYIQDGEQISNLISDQVEMFNTYFTNVESSSFSTQDESSKFVFEKFKELKKNNTFKTPGFSFKPFNIKDIESYWMSYLVQAHQAMWGFIQKF